MDGDEHAVDEADDGVEHAEHAKYSDLEEEEQGRVGVVPSKHAYDFCERCGREVHREGACDEEVRGQGRGDGWRVARGVEDGRVDAGKERVVHGVSVRVLVPRG